MDREHILHLHGTERRMLEWPGFWHETTPFVSRNVSFNPAWRSAVTWAMCEPQGADEMVAFERGYFASLNRAFEWKVYGYDWPPNLLDALSVNRFGIGPEVSFMVMNVFEAGREWDPARYLDIRLARDEQGVRDFVEVEHAVWDESEGARWASLVGNAPEYVSLYVAYHEGQPVSCARANFHPSSQFCSLWGGATLPQFRGMGFYLALVAARVDEARRRGAR
jgi:GNAT superfamily N-acetyltransferase